MTALLINLAIPLVIAVFLLHTRRTRSVVAYLLSSLALIAAGILVWVLTRDIYYHYNGPLAAGGFRSWAVPAAILTIVIVCAVPLSSRYARAAQALLAVFGANLWFLSAGWVA